jgi:hypothetical protein
VGYDEKGIVCNVTVIVLAAKRILFSEPQINARRRVIVH